MPYYNNTYGNGYPSYAPVSMSTTPVYQNNAQNPYSGYQSYDSQQDTTVSWVQGKSGAEAYPLAPGRKAMLMDSNEPILYVKQTDASGRYMPLQSYRLVPIEEQSMLPNSNNEAIDYDRIRDIVSEEVNRQIDNITRPKKEGK